MSQLGIDARCFGYGEHILPHLRHPPQNQVDKWSIINLMLIIELVQINIIHRQNHTGINHTLSLDVVDKHDCSD